MIDKDFLSGAKVNAYFRDWVHPTVRGDEVAKARHSSLIASHMLGGLVSAFVFAGYFAWAGAPGFATAVAAGCFLAPIGIALFLSRTGMLPVAHLLSAAQLTALVTLASALSGGTQSFALLWLAIVPLEAALSADRRMMLIATGLAGAALAGLHLATGAGWLPDPVGLPISSRDAAFATCLGAVGYAGALAANIQQIHRGAARELEASRERYRLIAENANDLITRHEAGGQITYASHASQDLLGLAPNALIRDGFEAALADDDRARYRAAIGHCLEAGKAVAEEFRIARDGTETWIEMRAQRAEGEPNARYVVAVTRDVTKAKAEALEIAKAREDAERASRAKSAFLATMSHELRTPLSSIIGFAEILHRDLLIKEREPKLADYCRIIHQSGEHLLSLVKDLLDVSRIESGKLVIEPEPFALADVAVQTVEAMRPLADGKAIRLVTAIEPNLPDLLADRRATRQILINLVTNAVKFTRPDGTITVGANRAAALPLAPSDAHSASGALPLAPSDAHSASGALPLAPSDAPPPPRSFSGPPAVGTASGASLDLWVADDGIGIAPEHISRIVQPFYQIETGYDRQNEGVGLGLSIVRGLVELHGGRLRIESVPGKGSKFIVTLPADTEIPVVTARPKLVIDIAEIYAQRQQQAQAAATATGTVATDETPQPRSAAG